MGLESATYISDLVSTNPVGGTDSRRQGDDHLRLIKAALLATFPNITGAVTATHGELNVLDGITATTAELNKLAGVIAAIGTFLQAANAAAARAAITAEEDVFTTEGDVLFEGAAGPSRLGIGTAGQALVVNSGATAPEWGTAGTTQANQAAVIAETNEDTYVPPDLLVHHPGAIKGWASVSVAGGVPTLDDSFNVTSVTDTATGRLLVTWDLDFASAAYAVLVGIVNINTSMKSTQVEAGGLAAGSVAVESRNSSSTLTDPEGWSVLAIGDRA